MRFLSAVLFALVTFSFAFGDEIRPIPKAEAQQKVSTPCCGGGHHVESDRLAIESARLQQELTAKFLLHFMEAAFKAQDRDPGYWEALKLSHFAQWLSTDELLRRVNDSNLQYTDCDVESHVALANSATELRRILIADWLAANPKSGKSAASIEVELRKLALPRTKYAEVKKDARYAVSEALYQVLAYAMDLRFIVELPNAKNAERFFEYYQSAEYQACVIHQALCAIDSGKKVHPDRIAAAVAMGQMVAPLHHARVVEVFPTFKKTLDLWSPELARRLRGQEVSLYGQRYPARVDASAFWAWRDLYADSISKDQDSVARREFLQADVLYQVRLWLTWRGLLPKLFSKTGTGLDAVKFRVATSHETEPLLGLYRKYTPGPCCDDQPERDETKLPPLPPPAVKLPSGKVFHPAPPSYLPCAPYRYWAPVEREIWKR